MIEDEQVNKMEDVFQSQEKKECKHQYKFDHAAHYGHFDIYKCTKCDGLDLKYWK